MKTVSDNAWTVRLRIATAVALVLAACNSGEMCEEETSCSESEDAGVDAADANTDDADAADANDADAAKDADRDVGQTVDGRRFVGLHVTAAATSLGEQFARMAYNEAASAIAFVRIASVFERENNAAAKKLVTRCRNAAKEEERHAAIFEELAGRYGVSVPNVSADEKSYTLADLVEENLCEGLVREHLGAAMLAVYAERSTDAELRAQFAAIGADEADHAELSEEIHRYALERCDDGERERLEQARKAAWNAFLPHFQPYADDWSQLFGALPATATRALAQELRRAQDRHFAAA